MSLFGGDKTPEVEKPDIWEEVGEDTDIYRTRTPEGWLIMDNQYHRGGLTYVPDADHKWRLG